MRAILLVDTRDDDGKLLASAGTSFEYWDYSEEQFISGEWVYVEDHEIHVLEDRDD